MGRKKPSSQIHAEVFSAQPEALEREIVKDQQVRFDEQTIVWGDNDDSLPQRILQAVNQSPTTTSCLGKVADYMQGSGFEDKGLMKFPIDEDGTTLWEYHQNICDYMSKIEGFAVRFLYNIEGLITQSYVMGIESCRFVRPEHSQSKKIRKIKYNPYFGTSLYNRGDSIEYNTWEPDRAKRYAEILAADKQKYQGQVYFYGNPRVPYKFYPVPKYWSGSHWIYVDAQTQTFMKKLLDNGFFESALITMIGDPNSPSQNPKYIKKKIGVDGATRNEFDGTTLAKEFSDMMSQSFSGADKAGKAMVLWANNKDNSPIVQPFPINTNFDNITGTLNNAIRGITIATEVQAILANLPQQGSSLGSDGDSMRMAVELMQARVREPQVALEQFYNDVLLKNHQSKTQAKVKIVNHSPLSNQIVVPDKVWEWMNDEEKAAYVQKYIPAVEVKRVPGATTTSATEVPITAQADPIFKNLGLAQIDQILGIARRVGNGKMSYDKAKEFLMQKFGLSDEQANKLLTEKEPEEEVLV